ncbi:MAG: hypothetical protein ACYST9_06835 [Planctomycetota bacterium]|jgi:uncharacterized protein YjeT (DUF2065 family)
MSDAQIFQVFSLVYIAIGVGIGINPDFYKKLYGEFIESSIAMYFGGVAAVAIGYLIVTFHNTWTKDFSVIITVIGWMALIKGIFILAGPKVMIKLTKAIISKEKTLKIQAVMIIIFGLLLAFLGFCPKSPI